jgi:magnesium-transporting ATPase (P-type)
VPGDIVRLRSGDRVPADLRLIETTNLRIEESALTGESLPSDKNTEPVRAEAGVGDRHGMAYSGTMVAAGRGIGVVTATGAGTELGRINRMIARWRPWPRRLTRQMNRSSASCCRWHHRRLATLMFVIGWTPARLHLDELFLAAIGFAVAAIPEGLPAVLTITLALGVQRMAQRNAITRKLNAVETLGSVTVICSDKTGTLTRNEMTVRHVITRAGEYDVRARLRSRRAHHAGREAATDRHPTCALIEVMAVANDSDITEEDGQWKVTGEPTEGALRTLARKAGIRHRRLRTRHGDSLRVGQQVHGHPRPPAGRRRPHPAQGAPDRLLDRCAKQRGGRRQRSRSSARFWEDRSTLGAEGLRVLAAAARDVDDSKGD